MRNAIDNAVRYTPPGGSVKVSVHRSADTLCFVVEDTGPGIDATDRVRVFEPFVRLPGTGDVGSGLGLSIALAAAEAMGGTITLADRDGPGSGLRFVYRQAASTSNHRTPLSDHADGRQCDPHEAQAVFRIADGEVGRRRAP